MFPIGLPRKDAARSIGCCPRKFDELVSVGAMPKPRLIGSKKVWSYWDLKEAFDALPELEAAKNEWDEN